MGEIITFYILATLISICSVVVVAAEKPATATLYLALDLFFIAALYVLLQAPFVTAIQIFLYAGAIVMSFLFVIKPLNIKPENSSSGKLTLPQQFILMLNIFAFTLIGFFLVQSSPVELAGNIAGGSETEITFAIGNKLFENYLWPFGLASILILLSVISYILITKNNNDSVESKVA